MRRHRSLPTWIALLGAAGLSACAHGRPAGPDARPPNGDRVPRGAEPIAITAVELSAEPREYKGPCPATITFHGVIDVEGGPGTLTYRFARSDRATGPAEVLSIAIPGRKEVATTWTLGEQPERPFEGWQQLIVLAPRDVASKPAGFSLTCE